jgi:hypothetical protein
MLDFQQSTFIVLLGLHYVVSGAVFDPDNMFEIVTLPSASSQVRMYCREFANDLALV